MRSSRAPLVERAPAKVNLTLSVLGRRSDGYHTIDSLVVFADVSDLLSLTPGGPARLSVRGNNAHAAGAISDNLVLRAANALAAEVRGLTLGRFALYKRLPVAAGLGGGSADAAATLRLLARANGLSRDDRRLFRAALKVGADVPVCIDTRPRRMQGIGERLSMPLTIPRLPAVLVNPGVAVATKDVFVISDGMQVAHGKRVRVPRRIPHRRSAFLALLAGQGNDLEPAAITLAPVIATALARLRMAPGCELARMSGSGATCFGIFTSPRAAAMAARRIKASHPTWWVQRTIFS